MRLLNRDRISIGSSASHSDPSSLQRLFQLFLTSAFGGESILCVASVMLEHREENSLCSAAVQLIGYNIIKYGFHQTECTC